MDQIDIEKLIQELKKFKFSHINLNHWDEAQKQQITLQLKNAGFTEFKIYKERDQDNRYLIILDGANVDYLLRDVQKVYAIQRSLLLKCLPLVLVFILLACTAIWSSHEEALMAGSMILGLPIVLGALTTYFMILSSPRPVLGKIFKVLSIVFFIVLIFGVIVLKEGVICIVMMIPPLVIGLLIGAGLMHAICNYLWKPTVKIYSLALLPLLLLLFLPDFSRDYYGQTQRSMIIHAPQAEVFKAINQIGEIKAQEVPYSFIFTIGFPKPIFGMTEQRAEGIVRTIQWERGVKFEEKVVANHPPYLLSWDYQFNSNSFPKGSLDDHVEVGGQYFDLLKTDYQLAKIDAHTTKLVLTIDYRVSTEFNWYSKLWIHYVLGEFSDVVMTIHKNRLE
ncbi:hypothetical protein B9T33_09285 [Acinetobacter sp. ANC 5054]|uniref:hypothetical protein n=1 Tax=Acinetobacter sp. ANC 5054 TaxID=1977877 RepID=UPI000A35432B|nr:hypothetical protein [Acinetobacter sp. ANC 5054]OTG80110.1 hypothetical protein B9T33_09285 [Acinetobacter sp. ANC 5054]